MSLSLDEVRRAAALARLRLTAEEEELFATQLGRIVAHIDHLKEFETAPAEPDPADGLEAADEPHPDSRSELFLDEAPQARGPFFVVPRMHAGSRGNAADALDE
jgi:aspartyl-tRNA(Asn)/glutamyl-tRNA(Gln) amidotransferase subunit C